ncbi:redox-sensing transcriptional repressor Rex [Syntrophotalea carbinolica DSM 2380]|uniref:Redox-sensing transcriptional repressor Rex n=1 Tax=Syntrophotalea carbinolica (strain DSM 2380 / NBRC 103641 / GraBd1) TaxID=338963 RepID=Q3A470_SYNC1|nr:redox-sensing transcriptional repressor Rex [Syntrophotalea carbinolica]ABA88837.1 redox-sensing transcriptional repressor Rex [Syntrophotalea carbinolica DSM 2380]
MKKAPFKVEKLPSVRRLPTYLQILRELSESGEEYVSSVYLAEKTQAQPILVRKDLELTQVSGVPRIGYPVTELIKGIEDFLGWGKDFNVFLVGIENIGAFLLKNRAFLETEIKILAAFDDNPKPFGEVFHGVPVFPTTRLGELLQRTQVRMAILSVPFEKAQKTTDFLVASGIKGIWNFTPANLLVPDDVVVQKENFTPGLAELTVKMNQRDRDF